MVPTLLNPIGRSTGVRYVTYIESTGTQYIDSGWYLPSDSHSFRLEMKFIPSTSQRRQWCCMCGLNRSRGGGTRQYYLLTLTDASTTGITAVNGYAGSSVAFTDLSDPFLVSMAYDGAGHTSVTANGNSNGFSDGLQNDQAANLYIFAPHYDPPITTNPQNISAKLFYFKITEENALVRDFIPVLDKAGVACLYDRVSKQFFYNSGSGQFQYA